MKLMVKLIAAIGGLLILQSGWWAFGGELSFPNGRAKLSWKEKTGSYAVTLRNPDWEFSGKLPSASEPATQSKGTDAIGKYRQVNFAWRDGDVPMHGCIRVYEEKPLVLFSDTCDAADKTVPAPFPDFQNLPAGLHVFSYAQNTFAPPTFRANECSTPWLLFDDADSAAVISPASHFMVASMFGNGHKRVASGFNPRLHNVPPGTTQQTLLAFGPGINRTWNLWGRSLSKLRGAKRPANDADALLKYLSYWTDNGATYYYNYNTNLGYAGTLRALVAHYRKEHIPVHSLQLDSWWYFKSFTGPGGKIGKTKSPGLPAGEWNRYGGLLTYRPDPFLFPHGLAEFQKSIGLPLVTHNRWIDLASPYREKYKISGVAAVDPKFWNDLADYMQSCGIVTYEQDWLDHIYKYSPAFSSTLGTGAAFVREMARACREHGITMQYCMPYPCYFMEGSRYKNLTTIRVSDDRFAPSKWDHFLYTSQLAYALGIWPWADVFMSPETNNVLLATLSAGPVGIGDPIGDENKANIFKSVRADGVIVKPDVPCVPLDQCYITDATQHDEPLLASTYTDHDGLRTSYVFVFNRSHTETKTAQFTPAELGYTGGVCIYNYGSGTVTSREPHQEFKISLPPGGTGYFIVAPVGPGGIAFFGDLGKFVSAGRQRISRLEDKSGKLAATVLFAGSEKRVELHGFAKARPAVTVRDGTLGKEKFDPATGQFTVEVSTNQSKNTKSESHSVRQVLVQFSTGSGHSKI